MTRAETSAFRRANTAQSIYSGQGDFLSEIPYDFEDAVSDILIGNDGSFYLPMFHSGDLLRVKQEAGSTKTEVIATGFESPSGVAMDSKGRVFVSNFTGDISGIDVLYT